MTLALLVTPRPDGRLFTIALIVFVLYESIVWGSYLVRRLIWHIWPPRVPRRSFNVTRRVLITLLVLAALSASAAIAGPPVIRDPCWVCSPDLNWAEWILSGCWACAF